MADEPHDQPTDAAFDLCAPFLQTLPVSGASVTVIGGARTQHTVCSSDAMAVRIDELQFSLGEGPQWVASSAGEFVAVPDVASDLHERWPVFGSSIRELDVGAIFAVPMTMGAVTVGAVTLHRVHSGDLTGEQRSYALAIASAIASTAVHRAMRSAGDDHAAESSAVPALRREVHQATGMMLVQLDTSATDAYSRLQAYAFAQGRTIQDVARDVVNRTLEFDE